MRITLDIPESLVTQVQKILSTETKTETIIQALEKVTQWHKRQQLINYQGKIDMDIDLDELRERNENLG